MGLNRAFAAGDCDIGLIQALIIASCWRAPTDRSAWIKLGTAIRLGYQLGLHKKRVDPLPQNEMDARMIIDGERTWFVLSCE